MKINSVPFTFERKKIMNPPPILQNVDYSKELDKVYEKKEITSIEPSDIEKKVEKGQWPQGWYGSFPNELFVVKMPTIEFLEMVQKIKPVYGARIDYGATILKPTTEDLTKIYKPAFNKSKIDIKV